MVIGDIHLLKTLMTTYSLKFCITSVSETIRKSKVAARQSLNCIKNKKQIKWKKNDFQHGGWNSYTLAAMWHDHDIRQVTAPFNVACGSGIAIVNSPSGSTLQCDTWLWDDMPLNWPGAAPCNVTRSSGIMTLNSPGGSTLHCSRWLWDDVPLNSPKRPPYWNSTSGFDFDHIIAVDTSLGTSLRNFIQIGPPSAEKNDVISIFKMADLSHGF